MIHGWDFQTKQNSRYSFILYQVTTVVLGLWSCKPFLEVLYGVSGGLLLFV